MQARTHAASAPPNTYTHVLAHTLTYRHLKAKVLGVGHENVVQVNETLSDSY